MGDYHHLGNDFREEFDVNFDDTRQFALHRWNDIILETNHALAPYDWACVTEERDWQSVLLEIRSRSTSRETTGVMKRLLNHMSPLPRSLSTLISNFTSVITPLEVRDINVLWGLLFLNIKLSCVSAERLAHTTAWMRQLRSVLELFNRCWESCEDDLNEARISMLDLLEYLFNIFSDSIVYLRYCPTDREAERDWSKLNSKIKNNITEMESLVRHLNELNSYSKVNLERQVKNLNIRHAPLSLQKERCTFPVTMLPRARNQDFFGRADELARIDKYLDYRGNTKLRTYTIYGRRGVGKTDLALEYAHTNPSGFDAIFWVQCETSLSLRQSFTDIAVELNLPGADKLGHHEENQLAVQCWLKTTKRKWMLIFDNAERESIIRGYWPVGANGAILITSRRYYNFTNDSNRKGDTVKPFTERQSWDLLMMLLGPEWQDFDRKGLIRASEAIAAKELLNKIGGLALGIEQAASLIKNPRIGGATIASTYESFKEHKRKLPPRATGQSSDIIQSLDSLWNMTFTNLTRNSRDLLGVLSLLSPDGILVDLFLPKNQNALDGKLRFCKQNPEKVDLNSQMTLSSVIKAPPALQDAIAGLVKFKLIKEQGRELWVHRVVQEAMNYHSAGEFQEIFDSACALVYEAFPKTTQGEYLAMDQRGAAQAYIPHAAHLGRRYAESRRIGSTLKGSDTFIKLLRDCSWYLYEVSDYDVCIEMVRAAWSACEDQSSLLYGDLCNIAGAAYYEINKLDECRKNWEIFSKIQESLLPCTAVERSMSFQNMGNLESATGNLDDAMKFFEKEIAVRIDAGDAAATLLANSYLCLSRVYHLKREYEQSFKILAEAEALFFRTSASNDYFLSRVHYAYGHINLERGKWDEARRDYNTCLKLALLTGPIHPITAAAYYSLGCVEFELGNNSNARNYLDKAMSIAQLRSPHRDDGTMARILWKISVVLEQDPSTAGEANEMRIRAEMARKSLMGCTGGMVFALDDDGNPDENETEDSYNTLVPGYFR